MKTTLVSFLCLLNAAAAFVRPSSLERNGLSLHRDVSTAVHRSGRWRVHRSQPLSMGFDVGKMLEKMTDPRYARVRHILIEEKGEEAKARLEDIKQQVGQDADKFSEFATQISTCTSAVRHLRKAINPLTGRWIDEDWRSPRTEAKREKVYGIAQCCFSVQLFVLTSPGIEHDTVTPAILENGASADPPAQEPCTRYCCLVHLSMPRASSGRGKILIPNPVHIAPVPCVASSFRIEVWRKGLMVLEATSWVHIMFHQSD